MRLRSELSLGRQSKGERARAGERENPDQATPPRQPMTSASAAPARRPAMPPSVLPAM